MEQLCVLAVYLVIFGIALLGLRLWAPIRRRLFAYFCGPNHFLARHGYPMIEKRVLNERPQESR